ncbi:MAG TPA: hypothetical protein VH641_14825 [Streptosporangiaceae bacterium]
MAFQVGSAFIPVKPDLRGFHKTIAAEFKALGPEAEKWGADTGKRFASGFQDELRGKFARLPHAQIEADADTAKADAELDRVARDRTARIDVSLGGELRKLLVPGALLAGSALGPSAVGLGAGVAGAAVAFGAAGTAAAAFGAIAVPMFKKVTAAQSAYTKAVKAYDQASTKAQRVKALKDEKAALASLTPAEKGLAKQLGGLKAAWAGLQKAEEPVVARSLAPWFGVAATGLKLVRPLIDSAAGSIQFLGIKANAALNQPFWGRFFTTLSTSGGIALDDFGTALGHVADGLAHLFVQFAPDIDKLPKLINGWATSFDNWATHYKRSGFDNFIKNTFTPENVANLKSTLKASGTLLGNVAKAVQNISPAALGGLSNVLIALSKLTPGQIEALGILYTASKLGSSVSGLGALVGVGGGKGKRGGFAPSRTSAEGGGTTAKVGKGIGEGFASGGIAHLLEAGVADVGLPVWLASVIHLPKQPKSILQSDLDATSKDNKAVVASIKADWKAVSGSVKADWHAVTGSIKADWNAVKGFGKSIVASIRADWNSVTGSVKADWHSVEASVKADWNGTVSWLRGIGGRVKSAVGRLGSILVSAGKAVLTGFLSGLKSAWSGVTSFVSGIGSWISAHKGPIERDRQLLRPHGKAIMAGLHQGLREGFGPVQAFTAASTAVLAGLPTVRLPGTPRLPGAAAVTGPGGVTVHVLLDGQVIEPRMVKVVTAHDQQVVRRARAGTGGRG